jgi:hypothetical protein
MNICFYCKRPVPGDWAVRVSVGFWWDKKIQRMGYHGPELCFHMECARSFAHTLLCSALKREPRQKGDRRMKLRAQLDMLVDSQWHPIEPDYAKPPRDWRRREA